LFRPNVVAILLVDAILVSVGMGAQVGAPERRVNGNVITSKQDPAARIELAGAEQYLGADRFVLLGIANCELHAWVAADAEKKVQRLYWVQFEGYLPTKPEMHHTYDSPRRAGIGGLDFYVDTWVRGKNDAIEPGSDREHIEKLIRSTGYGMPEGMMYVRFVHLLDAAKRKELMIIYGEDLAPTGLTAPDLQEGGAAHGQWRKIDRGLIERAEKNLGIRVE
jgi:hypothetical protein